MNRTSLRSFAETLTFKLWLKHVCLEPVARPATITESLWDELDTEQRRFVAWHEWMHEQAQLYYAERERRHLGVVAATDYITNPNVRRP